MSNECTWRAGAELLLRIVRTQTDRAALAAGLWALGTFAKRNVGNQSAAGQQVGTPYQLCGCCREEACSGCTPALSLVDGLTILAAVVMEDVPWLPAGMLPQPG